MTSPASRAYLWVLCAAPLIVAGCAGGGREVPEGPLGWQGPIEARETKRWPARTLEEAPRWKIIEPPSFVVVPDSVAPDGKGSQRYVAGAVVTADGRLVLLVNPDAPDSVLLHIFDPASGEEARVPAPGGEHGEPLLWGHPTMAAHGGGVVVIGSTEGDAPGRSGTEGVWFADADGDFRRPASHVDNVGPLLGVLSDGALVAFGGRTATTDTSLISSILLVSPVPADSPPSRANSPKPIFETAVARDLAADYPVSFFWAHQPRWSTGVSGDTIWTIPTERPELVGLDRSGEVLLKVAWEAGSRTIPVDASDEVREELRGLKRFPAARRLIVGTTGLVHVQRVAWGDGRPRIGPEWLVFGPEGDLVARLDVPRDLEAMAFGPGLLVARARDEAGVVEIRVYALRKPTGG